MNLLLLGLVAYIIILHLGAYVSAHCAPQYAHAGNAMCIYGNEDIHLAYAYEKRGVIAEWF